MNYYEHDIKVKVIDNVLSHEKEWAWFVRYTEENFEVELKGDSIKTAVDSFREISEVFVLMSKIREITDAELPITKDWLKEIDILAQFYNGTMSLHNIRTKTDFSAIMKLLIYAGKIYGQIKNVDIIYYTDIFIFRNIFLLFDIELFKNEKHQILSLFDEINHDVENERKIFLDNINKRTSPCKKNFVIKHEGSLYNANCFGFHAINDDDIETWEEKELLNMLAISFKDGKLIPKYTMDSISFPDYTEWTEEILLHIKEYFSLPITNFIIESMEFVLYKKNPSSDTINKHFALLYEYSEGIVDNYSVKILCSSLELILLFFQTECRKSILPGSYISFNKVLEKIYDDGGRQLLYKIKANKGLVNKQIEEKLKRDTKLYLESVNTVCSYIEFMNYICSEAIRSDIEQKHFLVLSKKFDMILTTLENLNVASLFLEYFLFLVKIKNNKEIIKTAVSKEIIRIRRLWKERFYEASCNCLQTVSLGSISVPKDYEGQVMAYMQGAPIHFAKQVFKLNEQSLILSMQRISASPLSMLVSRITINEDFPEYPVLKIDGQHPLDERYLNYVDRIKKQYGYKFINDFSSFEYTEALFREFREEIQLTMQLINNVEVLYDEVIKQNPEFDFIDYPSNICLAHITQLFPVLESRIRQLGELCGIVPVRESLEESNRLKEPDTVLNLVLSHVMTLGGDITYIPDLYFIHFCMYGENGMNIRNACIHGKDYCYGRRLQLGFKLTVVCLYMIGFRIDFILSNMKKEGHRKDIFVKLKKKLLKVAIVSRRVIKKIFFKIKSLF